MRLYIYPMWNRAFVLSTIYRFLTESTQRVFDLKSDRQRSQQQAYI